MQPIHSYYISGNFFTPPNCLVNTLCEGCCYLSDSVDKLCLLGVVAAHTPPVLLLLTQLGVAGAEGDEIAGVCRALGTPDTAEHRPQLGGIGAAGTGTDEILGLGWNKQTSNPHHHLSVSLSVLPR